ncbi:hypothetical protein BST95_08980 [Halioglobus japonicus]|uniref:Uncharacterized protein n=1 Tax=Halioglobus japonicus TaxID=930805 RepID=A0AAP8MF35_9GAMM|nr:hypothetical protein [Halioglobus japonicus]AQA18344.1 hypothetical protein BST95_08980 [Halioglobus japonicus]PLW86362.1 hypothetical protein C0029_08020 [Halioglobus japonicus]GHD13269.1 hypothetical protein GCM10007052_15220 [Halioglobus japonicus]
MSDRFAKTFYLLHENGDRLWPVQMEDQQTRRSSWRVSDNGNTKAAAIEVTDEEVLRDYVINQRYAVRAATRKSGARASLYRPDQRAIRELVDLKK